MAETQAESAGPASPAADHVGQELVVSEPAGSDVAVTELASAEPTAAELADSELADDYELASYQSSSWQISADPPPTGAIHHIELWVPNLDKAITSWGWLLTELGYRMFQDWPGGRSWRAGHSYIVVEQSPARTASRHDRCRPGLNHLAFHVETRELVDQLTREAQLHGWKLMFSEQHPFAGGPQHYAAYLENSDGYEVELVAH
jgi:catechol 2,3-dioxygenase-like lactoylglutathione lyase family enzyme